MPESDRPVDDFDVWSEPCAHDYHVTHWGFPVVGYTCAKCGAEHERDVS